MRILALCLLALSLGTTTRAQTQIRISNGLIEGASTSGLRVFKGIPYAAPPVGPLRWQPPQSVANWQGVRSATRFGPRAEQRYLYHDMFSHSAGMSEDCLYLNVWTPAGATPTSKLPVFVYFYGGGFITGDASEHRYDGASLARRGIVYVSVNYRLNVFGFFSHPALTAESPHHASGNYGLLDQRAALQWVRRNIAAFGGDPAHVIIGGESAGSMSVSAQMASPLSRNLIAGAIGESGSILGPPPGTTREKAESNGLKFAANLGLGKNPTLAQLRALPADKLLAATASKAPYAAMRPTVDGWFFPVDPANIYRAGAQARVPLLAGVNSQEASYRDILKEKQNGKEIDMPPTVANYRKALKSLYGNRAGDVFALYPATNSEEVMDAAQDLASDRFITLRTWNWIDLATRTGGRPTYYYLYANPRPVPRRKLKDLLAGKKKDAPPRGAVHSSDIEFVLGNLWSNKTYTWTSTDQSISRQFEAYFENFIKTGNPNGPGLTQWPQFSKNQRLVIATSGTHRESVAKLRARYQLLNTLPPKK